MIFNHDNINMSKSKKNIDNLIIRSLNGFTTPEEEIELQVILKENKENQKKFLEYQKIWDLSSLDQTVFDTPKAFARFNKRIKAESSPQKTKTIIRSLVYFSMGAASVALLFLLLPWTQKATEHREPQLTSFIMPDHAKGNLKLPDNTIVWLNKNSQLNYPEVFTPDKREVSVEGEAYFEVTKNTQKPFIVNLGNERITVLGTSFNVKNKKDADFAEITLLSGKVRIDFEKQKKNYTLNPNERILYSKKTGHVKIEPVNASIYNIWIKDRLTFDNEKLSYIISCLEKWYDIKIEYTENIKKIDGISLSVRDESIEEVLKGIQHIAPIKYTILENNTIPKK